MYVECVCGCLCVSLQNEEGLPESARLGSSGELALSFLKPSRPRAGQVAFKPQAESVAGGLPGHGALSLVSLQGLHAGMNRHSNCHARTDPTCF